MVSGDGKRGEGSPGESLKSDNFVPGNFVSEGGCKYECWPFRTLWIFLNRFISHGRIG